MPILTEKDFSAIHKKASSYREAMTKFLRAIIQNAGESCKEKQHILTIQKEMEALGFDDVRIDPMGNILGFIGSGSRLIAFDAHIDTVGIGSPKN